MRLYRSLDEVEDAPDGRAVAVGMLDGVHIGHRALIARLTATAAADGLRSCVLTFEQHPLRTLRPDVCPPLIMDWQRKTEILDRLGVDEVIVVPFDARFAATGAVDFIRHVLAERLNTRATVCGVDFRFGRGAEGSVEDLRAVGGPLGIRTAVVELVKDDGFAASSTAIREAIVLGDVASANRLLGDPFALVGVVERGEERGARLGFPTANLKVEDGLLVPGEGVYACRARALEREWGAAVSIGDRPSFGGGEVVVEAHLIDYRGRGLYGCPLTLTFLRRLRGQIRYRNVDDLVRRMDEDVSAVRETLAEAGAGRVT
jgi:riboflavin kinase/FMN adenylyltransferase